MQPMPDTSDSPTESRPTSTSGYTSTRADDVLCVVVQLVRRDGSQSTIAMLPAASGDSAASIVTVSWDSLGTASIFSEGA